MNSDMNLINAEARVRDLERRAELSRRRNGNGSNAAAPAVVIRIARPGDRDTISRLTALEGMQPPASDHILLAEVEGEVLAGLAIDGERAFADPFRPTADLVDLLRTRAAHLRGESTRRRGRLRSLLANRARVRRPRGSASAPAPPGNETLLIR